MQQQEEIHKHRFVIPVEMEHGIIDEEGDFIRQGGGRLFNSYSRVTKLRCECSETWIVSENE